MKTINLKLSELLRRLLKNKLAVVSLIVLILICLACILAPVLTTHSYAEINSSKRSSLPTRINILGTDDFGRDAFARLLYGGRITLRVAFTSTVMAAVIGSIIGLTAGYFGGKADMLISPVLDVLTAIPLMVLILAFELMMGWGQGNFMYAMALAYIPQFARLIRASTMSIIELGYIEASRALGCSHMMIICRHVLHNVAPPLVVRFFGCAAEALLTCTIVGYLQIGITPPTPEWGSIIYGASSYIMNTKALHLLIIPCAVVAACILSLNLLSDCIRDALDPQE